MRCLRLASLLLVLAGCTGGSDGDITRPTPPPPPIPLPPASSGRIGAAGGVIDVALANGGSAQLQIPARALTGDTTIRLIPLTPDSGRKARFRIEPSGLFLRQAATITITLASNLAADDAISLAGSSTRVTLASTQSGRTLTATTRLLGYSPTGAAPLSSTLSARPGSGPEASPPDVSVSAVTLAPGQLAVNNTTEPSEIWVTSIDAAGQSQALQNLIAQASSASPTVRTSLALNLSLAALAQSGPLAAQFLDNAFRAVCAEYFSSLRTFRDAPMNRVGVFASGVASVTVWSAALQLFARPGGCPQGDVDVDQGPMFLVKVRQYVAFLGSRPAVSVVALDFELTLVSEFQDLTRVGNDIQDLGLTDNELFSQIVGLIDQLFAQVRTDANRLCTTAPGGQHRYLARLVFLLQELEALIEGSQAKVLADINQCATLLEFDVLRGGVAVAGEAASLGRRDGNLTDLPKGSLTARSADLLRIRGDMRSLQCAPRPNFVPVGFDSDALSLNVGTKQVALQPQGAGGRLVPTEGFTVPMRVFEEATNTVEGEPVTLTVVFVRAPSGRCNLQYNFLSEDFRTGGATFGELRVRIVSSLTVNDGILPQANQTVAYQHQLTTTDPVGPVAWKLILGDLPPGLALSPQGPITGIPTAVGAFTFSVRATSPEGTRGQLIRLTVAAPPLVITTAALRTAIGGAPYADTLRATGETEPTSTWTIRRTGGAAGVVGLPQGMLQTATGPIVAGTVLESGDFSYVVRVENGGRSAERTVTLRVTGPRFLSSSLPSGRTFESYFHTIPVERRDGRAVVFSGGQGLPSGLSLSPGTGDVSGITQSVGTFTVTVVATEAIGGVFTRRQLTLQITPGSPPPPPLGELGIVASIAGRITLFLGSSGIQPMQLGVVNTSAAFPTVWSIDSGTLGGSLVLSPSGRITGAPAGLTPRTVVLRVTNGPRFTTRTITFTFTFLVDLE